MDTSLLIKELARLAPPSYAMDWDNVGLLVGDENRQALRVYLALDISSQGIKKAVEAGCDTIITHHPLIFEGMKTVKKDDFIGSRIMEMIEQGMNYYAMHTNFDVAIMGEIVALRLGSSIERPLQVTIMGAPDPKDKKDLRKKDKEKEEPKLYGIGTAGELAQPITLQALAFLVKKKFGLPDVRYYGDSMKMIKKVAICPGSGKSLVESALNWGAECFITGDVDHHMGIDCMEKGMCVIDAGHHGLEHIFVEYMAWWFETNFPDIEVVKDDNESPFKVV